VDDLADACLFLMDHYDDSEIINIGVGKDISISEVADLIKDIVVSREPSSMIGRSPTARHANCWTSASLNRSAGSPRSLFVKGLR